MKKLLALAAVAALATGSAHAAPTIVYNTQTDGSFSAYFFNSPVNDAVLKTFTDTFTSFTITNPLGGYLSATIGASGQNNKNHADLYSAMLSGPGSVVIPFTITQGSTVDQGQILGTKLAPGTYTLSVGGKAYGIPGSAFYSGTIDYVATAAPEPATWGLMILGFGAVGFAMRRQRSRQRIVLAYA